ncbi:putative COPii-coated vesicle-associated protein [Nadsonia fulvescens var. elongata DSM 6958]|uniref:Endoplasmic reticulum-Golgi intermediate compartment protein n=1 Tax=Nadsonia fulvescens var. elongata DSM 6958 TaxID=857566 RepID=A0A1E3PFD0_9ASCO|nr:putative COPii-coated vesicle-associated protein [Nadsonia fulvescens var. elongata DSM 6958]
MDEVIPSRLKTFDAFPKVQSTYTQSTRRGKYTTVILVVILMYLIYGELGFYIGGQEIHQFRVNKTVDRDMQINVDITVAMDCQHVTANVHDVSGDTLKASELLEFEAGDIDFSRYANRHFIHSDSSLDDVMHHSSKPAKSLENNLVKTDTGACRIYGSIPVNAVQGDFHITAKGYGYHDRRGLRPNELNFTHIIDEFSFGEYYPKLVNPLDGTTQLASEGESMTKYHYLLSLIPTIYRSGSKNIQTQQYSYKTQKRVFGGPSREIPGIFLQYDIGAIELDIHHKRMAFAQWLIRMASILGGVITCSGWAFRGLETMVGRFLGKKYLQDDSGRSKGMLDEKPEFD